MRAILTEFDDGQDEVVRLVQRVENLVPRHRDRRGRLDASIGASRGRLEAPRTPDASTRSVDAAVTEWHEQREDPGAAKTRRSRAPQTPGDGCEGLPPLGTSAVCTATTNAARLDRGPC